MRFDLKMVCLPRLRPRICLHLAAYCTALCVVALYLSISVENKLIVTVELLQRHKLSADVTSNSIVRIRANVSEASPRLSLESTRSSPNESLRSSLNESLWSSHNKSVGPSLNGNPRSSFNESLRSSHNKGLGSSLNETTRVLEMLQKKGIVTPGGSGYDNRYKLFRNFTESQIDGIVAAFGIPDLNSSNFKDQLLACTGQALAKAKKPVNITNEGNVVMPKHFQKCKGMSFQKDRKTVALLSFPGSGNSWVRQLLETTTGIYTGTYKDCDDSYIFNGMIGEGVYTDNAIAVKIHFPTNDELKWLYERSIIYVVRNPFDAILAEWNRWQSALKNHDTAHLSTTTIFGKYHFYSVCVWVGAQCLVASAH